jgi:hypothetical protein
MSELNFPTKLIRFYQSNAHYCDEQNEQNEQKTKYLIAARNDRTIHDVGQSVEI